MSKIYNQLKVPLKTVFAIILAHFIIKVQTLHLKDNNSNFFILKAFHEVFPLFDSSNLICIVLQNGTSFGFIKMYFSNLKNVIIVGSFKRSLSKQCKSIVLFNTDLFWYDSFGSDELKTSYYFLSQTSNGDISKIPDCFSNASSPEVLIISLRGGTLYELSPLFPRPRHFIMSNVTEVIKNRGKQIKKENQGGSVVTVAAMTYPPFGIFEDINNPDGIEVLLVKELATQLNFTIKFLVHKNWGHLSTNGSWRDGVMQSISEGTAEVVIANVWQSPAFYKIMDFGPSLNKIEGGFLVRRPEQIDFQWQVFTKTFQPEVWIGVFVSFVLVAVLSHFGGSLESIQSWSGSILTTFGYFTSSTSDSRKFQSNSRILFTCWSVFSMLVTTVLLSGIVTRLTLPLYSPRVDTLQQLVQQGYYWTFQNYINYDNEWIKNIIFNMENQWNRIFEQKYKYMDTAEILAKAEVDKKITFTAQTYGDDFLAINTLGLNGHKVLDKFRLMKEVVVGAHVSFGVKKNSPLFDSLTELTLRFLEVGLPSIWKKEIIRRWTVYNTRHLLIEKDVPVFGDPQKLCLNKLRPVFYIWLFGLVIASLVFFTESVFLKFNISQNSTC